VVTESTPVSYLQLQDLDKLQKEAEMYQKENERLQTEVQLMKQELDAAERKIISHNHNHLARGLCKQTDSET